MKSVIDYLVEHKDQMPEKIALIYKEKKYTYKQLFENIETVAMYLCSVGIKKEDRVILSATGKPEYVICFLAVQYIGAITVPVDRAIKQESLLLKLKKMLKILRSIHQKLLNVQILQWQL